MGQLIYIEQKDKDEATRLLKGFTNEEKRKKTFINSLGAELVMKYLAQEGVKVSNIFNMHNIFRLREEFELADVMLPNIHIDVRMVYDENLIFIPKSHFEYDLKPDIYVVLKTSEDGSYVDFLGFFEPKIIDKTKQNDEYYFIDKSRLLSPEKFISYVRAFNGNTTQEIETDEDMPLLAMNLADNDISEQDKKTFMGYLKKSSSLREEMIEFDNFEWLSYTLTQEESVDKNFNKTVDEFDSFEVEDEFSMMEDNNSDAQDGNSGEDTQEEIEEGEGFVDLEADNIDETILDDDIPISEDVVLEPTMDIVEENLEIDGLQEMPLTDMEEMSDISDLAQTPEQEEIPEVELTDISMDDEMPSEENLSGDNISVENLSDENLMAIEDLPLVEESIPEGDVVSENVQSEDLQELADISDVEEESNILEENSPAEDLQDLADISDVEEESNILEESGPAEDLQDLTDLSEPVGDNNISEESGFEDDLQDIVDMPSEIVDSSETQGASDDALLSLNDLENVLNEEQSEQNTDDVVELENLSSLDDLLSASEPAEPQISEPADFVPTEISDSVETAVENNNTEEPVEISPVSYENSTVISNEAHSAGEIPIDINAVGEGESIGVLYDKQPEKDIESSTETPEKGKKGVLVVAAVATVLAIGGVTGYFMSQNKYAYEEEVPAMPENVVPADETDEEDGEIVENPLPEDAIKPKAKKSEDKQPEDVIETPKMKAKEIAETEYLEVKKLGWTVPDYVSYNDSFRKYLQAVGKSLKLALSSDLLLTNEYPYSNQIDVDIEMSKSGKLLSYKISKSSGSEQIDKIVLQTVKATMSVVKVPSGVIVGDKIRMTLKIYL